MAAGSSVLRGEMASVASVARNISRLDALEETMMWLRQGVGCLQAAGEARALTALLAACRPLESRAQQLANVKLTAGQALQRYVDQVAAMQGEARALQARKFDAECEREHTVNRIANVDSGADDAAGRTRHLQLTLDETDALLRMIEQQLTDLDHARSSADAACATAIHACTAHLITLSGERSSPGGTQGVAVQATNLNWGDLFRIALMTPEQVGDWWMNLSRADRQRLKQQHSLFVGNLNGVPFEDRIEANSETARRYINDAGISAAERRYWQKAVDGELKLVVLDKERHRIVEMLGDIGPDTDQVITYVPGTTTGLKDFVSGDAKRVPTHLEEQLTDAVIFVYKDFPGIGWVHNVDEDGLAQRGQKLAQFDLGAIGTDPRISGLPQAAIGYSAGMAVVGGSEMHGATFDQVISLGGSYVPDEWKPRPGTDYSDIRYDGDILNNLDEYPHFEGLNTINGQPEIFAPSRPQSPHPGEGRAAKHGRLGGGPETNLPVLDLLIEELNPELP